MPLTFTSLDDDLARAAAPLVEFLRARQYRVSIEKGDVHLSVVPTLTCTRKNVRLLVDVDNRIRRERLEPLLRYAKTYPRDTRVALAIPLDVEVSENDERFLVDNGVGVFVLGVDGAFERSQAKDQGVSAALVPLGALPPKVRKIVAPAYEKYERGDWRDAFKDAAQEFEEVVRRYVCSAISNGRVRILDKKGHPKKISCAEIDRLPMGPLAEALENFDSPNAIDVQLAAMLRSISKDRNAVTHHPGRASTEARLRSSVHMHMYTVCMGIKAALKC